MGQRELARWVGDPYRKAEAKSTVGDEIAWNCLVVVVGRLHSQKPGFGWYSVVLHGTVLVG